MDDALKLCEELNFEWSKLYQEKRAEEIADDRLTKWLDNGGREWLQEASRSNQEYHAQKKAHRKQTWKKIGNIAVKGTACICAAGVALVVPAGAAFFWSLVFAAVANVDQVAELWPAAKDPDRENLQRVYDQLEKVPSVRVLH